MLCTGIPGRPSYSRRGDGLGKQMHVNNIIIYTHTNTQPRPEDTYSVCWALVLCAWVQTEGDHSCCVVLALSSAISKQTNPNPTTHPNITVHVLGRAVCMRPGYCSVCSIVTLYIFIFTTRLVPEVLRVSDVLTEVDFRNMVE